MSSIMRRSTGLIAWSVMGRLLSRGRVQLLIFRQDAPLISPHPAHLAAEPYRASGLVLWREADVRCFSKLMGWLKVTPVMGIMDGARSRPRARRHLSWVARFMTWRRWSA